MPWPGRLGGEERLADPGQDLGRHAAALVLDAHDELRGRRLHRERHRPPAGLEGVLQQALRHLHERAERNARAAARFRHLDAQAVAVGRRHAADDLRHHLRNVDLLGRLAGPLARVRGQPAQDRPAALELGRGSGSRPRSGRDPAPREASESRAPARGWRPRWWRAACRARAPPPRRASSPPPAARGARRVPASRPSPPRAARGRWRACTTK